MLHLYQPLQGLPFSPVQDWGRAGDVAALGVCWHVPGQEEETFVFQLLSLLLHPELQRIQDHVSGEQPMSRWVATKIDLCGKSRGRQSGDFSMQSLDTFLIQKLIIIRAKDGNLSFFFAKDNNSKFNNLK